MRLQKFLRDQNIGSRRKCDALVQNGEVYVNGKKVLSPTVLLHKKDSVRVKNKSLVFDEDKTIKHLYFIYHKPLHTLSSHHDPQGRRLFTEDFKNEPSTKQRKLLFAGRLDFFSRGLMLLSTDGDFIQTMSHPSKGKEKEYLVQTQAVIDFQTLSSLSSGFSFAGVHYAPFSYQPLGLNKVKLTLNEGKNQQIRNTFRKLQNGVVDLFRIRIGSFALGNLASGKYRPISTPDKR